MTNHRVALFRLDQQKKNKKACEDIFHSLGTYDELYKMKCRFEAREMIGDILR